MELKYQDNNEDLIISIGSNRTFMELKCDLPEPPLACFSVLIVPLWN